MIISDKLIVTNPLVSILIITYNQEQYIGQAIESALDQKSEFGIEIIIADDCSKDKTREICLRYQKEYPEKIILLFQESNIGPVSNWLSILKMARGKYISQLGGDDYYIDINKISKQVNVFNLNPGLSAVYSKYKCLSQNTQQISDEKFDIIPRGDCRDLFIRALPIILQTTLIKKDILSSEYFSFMTDDKIKVEDFPTGMWIAFDNEVDFIDDFTVVYRIHEKSITNSLKKYQKWEFMRTHEYIRNKFVKYKSYKPDDWDEICDNVYRFKIIIPFSNDIYPLQAYASYNYLKKRKKATINDTLRIYGIKYKYIKPVIKIIIKIRLRYMGVKEM
jgi:glycosyltransferase involved in cell wall biosynthesis